MVHRQKVIGVNNNPNLATVTGQKNYRGANNVSQKKGEKGHRTKKNGSLQELGRGALGQHDATAGGPVQWGAKS